MSRKTEERRNKWLIDDVTAMINERMSGYDKEDDWVNTAELAKELIVVIRERVLDEIASAVRERKHKI